MCCFTQPVELVADTHIFARSGMGGRQFVVYEMHVSAASDLAMVLPIPVPPKSAEADVRFFNLEKYPTLFEDLNAEYPKALAAADARTGSPLKVVDVGAYEASFVPTVADFARLDPRFRLPMDAWKELPQYQNYGFTVFKLKPGNQRVHPMAFDFPRLNPREIFFPTVHIHDGKVHPTAQFDHLLFLQVGTGDPMPMKGWRESKQPAGMFVKTNLTQGIVDPERHIYRLRLIDILPNKDTILT